MEKSIKNHLCKYVRGTGLTKTESLQYINQIEKWYDSCGVEWTVSRLKDYHHWYITMNADHIEIPAWAAHTKSGYPKGIMGVVFQQRNPQRALALLSVHTAFINLAISKAQTDKFVKAVKAPELKTEWGSWQYPFYQGSYPTDLGARNKFHVPKVAPPEIPGFDCLTGTTIPVGTSGVRRLKSSVTRNEVVQTYALSWISCPDETLRFIGFTEDERVCPAGMWSKAEYAYEHACRYGGQRPGVANPWSRPVGKIACIQEPSLKARWIANPNRIAQHFMRPLQVAWSDRLRQVPTDCTFNQGEGVSWAKRQLSKGVKLSSTDLSSATDMLDMWGCLDIIHRTFWNFSILDWHTMCDYKYLLDHKQGLSEEMYRYLGNVTYFTEMSRGKWESPIDPKGTRWERGQPLGTAPSFFLLGLTNNACGYSAALEAGLVPEDSFRVIGDDIIMDSRMEPAYRKYISRLGAEINDTKCVSSSKVVEFAGHVITKQNDFLKRVKFKEISDNHFVQLVGMLGDQAVSLLRPRQRKQWDNFKYVPGVAVEGPYNPNSQNEPVSLRYDWYLNASGLIRERPEPERQKLSGDAFGNTVYFSLLETSRTFPLGTDHFNMVTPRGFSEDFQSSLATDLRKKGGDPRLENGKTMLEVFEEVSTNGNFEKFTKWKQRQQEVTQPTVSSPAHKPKRTGGITR